MPHAESPSQPKCKHLSGELAAVTSLLAASAIVVPGTSPAPLATSSPLPAYWSRYTGRSAGRELPGCGLLQQRVSTFHVASSLRSPLAVAARHRRISFGREVPLQASIGY